MSRTAAVRALLVAALVITAPAAAAAQADVITPEGTVWHLVSYTVDGERHQVPWNVDATLSLEVEKAGGSAGCNGFLATYATDGETLTVGDPGTTDVGCPDRWMDVEAGYMTALPATARWAIDTGPAGERGLYLYDAADDIILEFQEPSVGLTPADVGALTSLLDAQRDDLASLRDRVKDLERQIKRLKEAEASAE
jgi:heat shock protein HslJ